MALPIKHAGIYRFGSHAHSGYSLNAYTGGKASNGTNLCLYPSSNTDAAQQWRVLCAGTKADGKKLFFLNLIANGKSYGNNMALDRNTTAANRHNAQTCKSYNVGAAAGTNQLVYFEDLGANLVAIRLFSDGRALTGNAPGTAKRGTGNCSSTATANVHWAAYSTANTSQRWIVTAIDTAQAVEVSALDSVTQFPEESFFNAKNNSNFPKYLGECVWYVKGRYHETRKTPLAVSGHANTLWNKAAKSMTRQTAPVANSIACWSGGKYGHVAFVESVEGEKLTFSQANWHTGDVLSNGQVHIAPAGGKGSYAHDGKTYTVSRAVFEGLYGGFQGYIY